MTNIRTMLKSTSGVFKLFLPVDFYLFLVTVFFLIDRVDVFPYHCLADEKKMAFGNNDRRELFEHIKLDKEDSFASKEQHKSKKANILIFITCILEFIILAFVVALAFTLRWTTIFPVRRQTFSCVDEEISGSTKNSDHAGFAFESEIQDSVLYALSFCIPPFVIFVGEIGVWAFADNQQKSIRVLCKGFKVPQVIRRLLRFSGIFIFGAFALMIFVDVIKLMTGRLRPNFLELCDVNKTLCAANANHGDDRLCAQKDEMVLRYARTSFPSLYAALTSYSAVFIAAYIHGALRTRSVRVLRPFLSLAFCMLAMLSGLIEYSLGLCYWTDVIGGCSIGIVISVYLVFCVLHQFHEHIPEREILAMLHGFLLEHQLLVELTKEGGIFNTGAAMKNGIQIPRAQTSAKTRAEMYDKFQKDLSSTVEHFKERRNSVLDPKSHL